MDTGYAYIVIVSVEVPGPPPVITMTISNNLKASSPSDHNDGN